jgi:hypothetical protein
MLQYRLSTLFLIFFVVATTMALLGAWGIWIVGVLFLAALCLNQAERLTSGVTLAIVFIFFGIVCPGLLLPAGSAAQEAARRANCNNNMNQLALALQNYHDSHKLFPPAYTCDSDGKPLFSWFVSVLRNFSSIPIYQMVKFDEPWNGPANAKSLNWQFREIQCPSANHGNNDFTTNYIDIIGPGTIWRNEGTVNRSDLPDGGTHTVMLVETAESGKHRAEPYALTADQVLENMRTGKGVRISSYHPVGVNILFANGAIRCLPAKMPLSLWRKILDGELKDKDYDNLESLIDSNAPDMVDVYLGPPAPKPWPIIFGAIVWLIAIVLLFHRAVKSRKNPNRKPKCDFAGGP